jgi:hypothetical protein
MVVAKRNVRDVAAAAARLIADVHDFERVDTNALRQTFEGDADVQNCHYPDGAIMGIGVSLQSLGL